MHGRNKMKFLGAGMFAAIAASLCCIGPLLIAFASISGSAAYFTWLEPYRPFLLLIAIVALVFAWYQNLSSKLDCDCEEDGPGFFQSRGFLAIVTVTAVLIMTFPHYSGLFYKTEDSSAIISKGNFVSVEFDVQGMTCSTCEHHVVSAINLMPGIREATASYSEGKAYAIYDLSAISKEELAASIEKETGYKILKSIMIID